MKYYTVIISPDHFVSLLGVIEFLYISRAFFSSCVLHCVESVCGVSLPPSLTPPSLTITLSAWPPIIWKMYASLSSRKVGVGGWVGGYE